MKRTALALVATIALSACASTQTVLDQPPTEVFVTDSSPNEVAFCLANKNNTPAMDRDDGSKVVLIKNGYGYGYTHHHSHEGTVACLKEASGALR